MRMAGLRSGGDGVQPQTSVLVICEHELLGEGLAARLQVMGVQALVAAVHNDHAVVLALRARPDVVIIESTDPACIDQVTRLSPTSRIVDATNSVGRGYPTEAMRFEAILDALPVNPQSQTLA
jgi:DNA-binding NarL/FixJ family response regulator